MDGLITKYRTDFGSILCEGYRSYPKPGHPFGKRQRAVIKAIARRWWEDGEDVNELIMTREAA